MLDIYLTLEMGNFLEQIIKIYHPVLSRIFPFEKNPHRKKSQKVCEQITDISGLRRVRDCCHSFAHLRQVRQKITRRVSEMHPTHLGICCTYECTRLTTSTKWNFGKLVLNPILQSFLYLLQSSSVTRN